MEYKSCGCSAHRYASVRTRSAQCCPPAEPNCESCLPDGWPPHDMLSLAMAYIKPQAWRELYCVDEALGRGTLFRELYMPFRGGCGGVKL